MSTEISKAAKQTRFQLSLDAWAVVAAFLLAGFVRFGILKHIPW
jgi:hypothetical protein